LKAARFARTLVSGPSRAFTVALLLLLAALASPRVTLPRSSYDMIVVFDITQSMNVMDYDLDGAPASRLEFARHAARSALAELPCGSRVGWGAFAEYRSLLLLAPVEVCANYGDLVAALDRIDGRMRWGNASEIAKGVFWGIRAARDVGGNPALIFLTDGQEAPPKASASVPLFDDIKRGQIRGCLIGVGGDIPMPIPKTDPDGKPLGYWHAEEVIQRDPDASEASAIPPHEHLSELRQSPLQNLALQVGFDYAKLFSAQSLRTAMLNPRFAVRQAVRVNVFWLPAGLALLLLLGQFWPDRVLTPVTGFRKSTTLSRVRHGAGQEMHVESSRSHSQH
jgi:mxaL protein